MALLVLSVVGSDRPGLTRALAAAVLSAGVFGIATLYISGFAFRWIGKLFG